jgi:hypothetical protein
MIKLYINALPYHNIKTLQAGSNMQNEHAHVCARAHKQVHTLKPRVHTFSKKLAATLKFKASEE